MYLLSRPFGRNWKDIPSVRHHIGKTALMAAATGIQHSSCMFITSLSGSTLRHKSKCQIWAETMSEELHRTNLRASTLRLLRAQAKSCPTSASRKIQPPRNPALRYPVSHTASSPFHSGIHPLILSTMKSYSTPRILSRTQHLKSLGPGQSPNYLVISSHSYQSKFLRRTNVPVNRDEPAPQASGQLQK